MCFGPVPDASCQCQLSLAVGTRAAPTATTATPTASTASVTWTVATPLSRAVAPPPRPIRPRTTAPLAATAALAAGWSPVRPCVQASRPNLRSLKGCNELLLGRDLVAHESGRFAQLLERMHGSRPSHGCDP